MLLVKTIPIFRPDFYNPVFTLGKSRFIISNDFRLKMKRPMKRDTLVVLLKNHTQFQTKVVKL